MMAEDAYWAGLCCQLELIRAGTTCFIDPGSYFPRETAQAAGESGLRGVIARTAFDLHSTPIGELPEGRFRETTHEALERAQLAGTELNGRHDGRFRCLVALRVRSGRSVGLIRRISKSAD